jgi:hypothetical protein
MIVARRLRVSGYLNWWQENTADYGEGFVSWIEDIRRVNRKRTQQ